MAGKKKAAVLNAQDILDKYTEYVLEQEYRPSSVYKFCSGISIEETEFYQHYASLESIEAAFYVAIHEHTMKLLTQNEDYQAYPAANKLLSYYFTFFEMATANRSYILQSLKSNANPLEALVQFKELRKHFLLFANELLSGRDKAFSVEQFQKVESRLLQEGAWVQFLFTFKFWMQDTSPGFEKTDIMIEKSVKASFDVLDNFPMKSVVDLGKFLWKERPFQ